MLNFNRFGVCLNNDKIQRSYKKLIRSYVLQRNQLLFQTKLKKLLQINIFYPSNRGRNRIKVSFKKQK